MFAPRDTSYIRPEAIRRNDCVLKDLQQTAERTTPRARYLWSDFAARSELQPRWAGKPITAFGKMKSHNVRAFLLDRRVLSSCGDG
jgi:hypothetical protein